MFKFDGRKIHLKRGLRQTVLLVVELYLAESPELECGGPYQSHKIQFGLDFLDMLDFVRAQ